jgi:hypothetical protein
MVDSEGGASNPLNVQARYANATKLLAAGQLDEATTEFVWLWENMLGLAPHMVGVRGSFMVKLLQQLVARHPPARERFLAFRDALTAVVDAGAPMLQQFSDWASLCDALGDADRVLAWFDRMGPGYDLPRELAGVVELRVVPLLRARGRWADIGHLFRDPMLQVRRQQQLVSSLAMVSARHPDRAAEMSRDLQRSAAASLALTYGALRAAGRAAEADAMLAEARSVLPGLPLDAEVEAVLAEIEGRPSPVA